MIIKSWGATLNTNQEVKQWQENEKGREEKREPIEETQYTKPENRLNGIDATPRGECQLSKGHLVNNTS